MVEADREPARPAPDAHLARRLPLLLRLLFVVAAGAAVAILASYLLRQIGL